MKLGWLRYWTTLNKELSVKERTNVHNWKKASHTMQFADRKLMRDIKASVLKGV